MCVLLLVAYSAYGQEKRAKLHNDYHAGTSNKLKEEHPDSLRNGRGKFT